MEEQIEVSIKESPGGFWNIWLDGEKVGDGPYRRAGDAQEAANAEGWIVLEVLKHGE
ncbi:hypothetical protein D3C75_327560 [compost metagenome]